jgi:hypothetical protein
MLSLPAGPRRLPRRALLAAVSAFALPPAAQASTVGMGSDKSLAYDDPSPASNDVSLRVVGNKLIITDIVPITSLTPACRVFNHVQAVCPTDVSRVFVTTQRGRDTVEYRLPHGGGVDLGLDDDRLLAGTRETIGRSLQPLSCFGRQGLDEISYASADRGVTVDMADGLARDGR